MIVCSMTSWRGRISTLGFAIFAFLSRQTIKPDRFILTLSQAEFPHKEHDLPVDLQRIIYAYNVDVKWMRPNIYSHKKYEVFRAHNNDWCIILDDDIIYPSDYIQTMCKAAKRHPESVLCFYSQTVNYENGRLIKLPFRSMPSHKNSLYSGLSMFPPNTFPMESFQYTHIRDKFVPKCDDSWVKAWLLKQGITVNAIHEFGPHCLIDIPNTQEQSIWSQYNSKQNSLGITTKYMNMVNVCAALNMKMKAIKIWPNMFSF